MFQSYEMRRVRYILHLLRPSKASTLIADLTRAILWYGKSAVLISAVKELIAALQSVNMNMQFLFGKSVLAVPYDRPPVPLPMLWLLFLIRGCIFLQVYNVLCSMYLTRLIKWCFCVQWDEYDCRTPSFLGCRSICEGNYTD